MAWKISTAVSICTLLVVSAAVAAPALIAGPPPVREFSMVDKRAGRQPAERPPRHTATARAASRHAQPRTTSPPSPSDYVSRALKPSKRFNLVGLSWHGQKEPEIYIRVRLGHDHWTRWSRLWVHADHSPDVRSREYRRKHPTSDPIWVGQADQIQYRVGGERLRDVRLHFVNSTGTATASDRLRTRLRNAMRGALATVAATALFSTHETRAATAQPTITPRSQWAGSQCNPRTNPSYGEVKLAIVHHTVSLNDYRPEDSAAIVLAICKFHRDTNGWNDIGYNFLVDKYGQIFEGRVGGIDKAVVGAQMEGYNSTSTGVANIGTFTDTGQSPEALDAQARLLAWKLDLNGVSAKGQVTVTSGGGATNRYPNGQPVTFQAISGHRDGTNTECPGDGLYAQLPQLRDLTAGYQAQAQPSGATYSLSIASSPAFVVYGEKGAVNGGLALSTGQPAGQSPVQLEVSSGGSWHRVRTAATDQAGNWSIQIAPTRRSSYRVAFTKPDGSGDITSNQFTVAVRPNLQVRLAGGRALSAGFGFSRGTIGRVAIQTRPSLSSVALIVDKSFGGGGRRIARRTLTGKRRGAFRTYLRFARPGSYRLSAYYPGDRSLSKGRSDYVTVRVS